MHRVTPATATTTTTPTATPTTTARKRRTWIKATATSTGSTPVTTRSTRPRKVTGTGYTGSLTSFNLGAEYFAGAVAGIGSATYTDKSVSKTFRSTKITGLACKGSRATVEGTGIVNSTKSVTFRIVVDDVGAGAGTDTYAISWEWSGHVRRSRRGRSRKAT